MRPQFIVKKKNFTYDTNAWCRNGPAEFPPHHWIISDHVFNSIVKSIDTKSPRNRNTFEENQEQQTETAHGIRV